LSVLVGKHVVGALLVVTQHVLGRWWLIGWLVCLVIYDDSHAQDDGQQDEHF
jgi:hypothetical protein